MSASRLALPVLAAAALAAAWWLGQHAGARLAAAGAPDDASLEVPRDGADDVGATALRLPDAPAPGIATAPPPMPASDARLVDAWPALLARAEAGDRVAACRLALLAGRCSESDMEPGPLPTPEDIATLEGGARSDAIGQAAFALEHRAPLQPLCEGVDGALRQALPTMLYRAARASDDPHALAMFAEGIAAGRDALFDDAGRRLHREHGAWAIDRLIARGEPHGLVLLWIASGPGYRGRVGSVMAPDEVTSHAAREMLREASRGAADASRSETWSRLDPTLQARVDARLAQLRERFGRDARDGGPPPVGQALMTSFTFFGPPPDGIAGYCEASAGAATAPPPGRGGWR